MADWQPLCLPVDVAAVVYVERCVGSFGCCCVGCCMIRVRKCSYLFGDFVWLYCALIIDIEIEYMMYDIFENEISGTITCQSTNYECTNNE